jgi:quinoprotein glucose dehydrogenase
LKQIDKTNVTQLQQVWFYLAGNNGFRFGFNPVIVDNVMYVLGKDNNVVALDATPGKELWVHDNNKPHNTTHRGINYWESKDRSDRRLFFSTDSILHAIDARTGKTVDSFGQDGGVDLGVGLGRVPTSIRQIQSGTPGRVFESPNRKPAARSKNRLLAHPTPIDVKRLPSDIACLIRDQEGGNAADLPRLSRPSH